MEPTTAALIAVSAAMLGAFTAWTLNYIQKAGRLSITWRLREPGTTTIEVIAKNTGQRQLRNVHITSSREGFRPVRLEEMGPGQEYCIESLCGKKESREYYTNTTWKHDMGCPGQRWRINPVDFSEIQTGELPPERVIANVLLEVEKYIKDSPVVRSAGATKSITGPNLGEWVLPPGIIAVLLPDTTEARRQYIRKSTTLGSNRVQRRANRSSVGTHAPRERLQIVIDPDVLSEDDMLKTQQYLSEPTLTVNHNFRHPELNQKSEYLLHQSTWPPRSALIAEGEAEYLQPPRDDSKKDGPAS